MKIPVLHDAGVRSVVAILMVLALTGQGRAAEPRSYRLPAVDLKQRIIWGATCELPDGTGLAFGGQDQEADDGIAHTRLKVNGEWKDIHAELRAQNPLQKKHDLIWTRRNQQKDMVAQARWRYFEGRGGSLDEVQRLTASQLTLEKEADALDAEPPPRALSPIVYDAKTKLFVIFGGDHLDYLMNDLRVFDLAKRQWTQRHPADAPPPRANHKLTATGDGKIVLTGGYTYTSNTDYMGGQYRDLNDGEWTYDIAANTWTGTGQKVPPDSRVYRTAAFVPEYFLDGPLPDAAAFQEWLRSLPANTWMQSKPPRLPKLNRDWGSAVLDPDRDLILRWSGGHSAHGGTDVLQYHLASNRWELPCAVEFPLGQLYSNTSYPEGVSFNRRPWITGHTYQSYGYDLLAKKMIFTGQRRYFYIYDPDKGDWIGRNLKPEGMTYNDCFYDLTICATPRGLVCWTKESQLFRFDAPTNQWQPLPYTGATVPGPVVDNSTIVYDAKRDRLVMARKLYGDQHKYDGELYAVDLKTLVATKLSPAGMAAAVAIPYLCQIRYDAAHDLMLVGATLPPDETGLRRTPAYDCVGNRWVSLRITGDDPSGKQGRNVSLGLMYDAKRNLFWAVDTDSHVFVLRLEPKTADVRALQ